MELVRGVPITEYLRRKAIHHPPTAGIVRQVCQAVQHAHQKGIIHRDLKPTNVLVTLHDDKPVPKVIDFGVAKAINQTLTDKTIYTQFAQMIGTPLYMSPEQAEHERPRHRHAQRRLFAGRAAVRTADRHHAVRPRHASKRQHSTKSAASSARKNRRNPACASARSTDSLPSIAAQAQDRTRAALKIFNGDLDWIAMKALEKDRTRRYETANAFAADVSRYLNDEPVEACPPSARYPPVLHVAGSW